MSEAGTHDIHKDMLCMSLLFRFQPAALAQHFHTIQHYTVSIEERLVMGREPTDVHAIVTKLQLRVYIVVLLSDPSFQGPGDTG
jgi:hypothetical protein